MNQIHHEGAGASNKRPGEISMNDTPSALKDKLRALSQYDLGDVERVKREMSVASMSDEKEAQEVLAQVWEEYCATNSTTNVWNAVAQEVAIRAMLAFANQQRERDGEVGRLRERLEGYRLKDGYVPAYIAGNNSMLGTVLRLTDPASRIGGEG